MGILTTYFPNLSLSESQIDGWFLALSDLTPEQFARGVQIFCNTGEDIYPGTNVLAKIRKYALSLDQYQTAAEAWEKVRLGATGAQVVLDNPISERVVKFMGGFKEMGMTDNPEAQRAHFFKMYEAELEKEKFQKMAGTH